METIYDWVTVTIFAGLIVLFLQRSSDDEPRDSIWQYLGAGVSCAVANYLGNEVNGFAAAALIVATIGYIVVALKPFDRLS